MTKEIFRPLGLTLKVTKSTLGSEEVSYEEVPVLSLAPGNMTIPWEKNKYYESVLSINFNGKDMALHLPLKKIEGDRGQISWSNWSLTLTIYNRWISSLKLEQKESLIAEMLRWEEGVEAEVYESEVQAEAEIYSLEKLKAS